MDARELSPLEKASILMRARERIADVTHWTRGASARDSRGNKIEPWSPHACQWCAWGAIRSVTPDLHVAMSVALELSEHVRVISQSPYVYLDDYNDGHRHDEVIAVFDAVIAQLDGTIQVGAP